VLVLNAGGPPPAAAVDASDADLDRAYELTLKSAVRATRAVLPGMRARGFGRIVAMTSIAVRQPIADLVHSNAMRAALTGYLKTLADEVAADGVTVNSVCTGMFGTRRLGELFTARAAKAGGTAAEAAARARSAIPAGRFGDPEEFGAVVAFLASERAGFLTGVALPLDGGASRSLL
jgi:3-oxoacyl-[acyl-carrier protein] reductase